MDRAFSLVMLVTSAGMRGKEGEMRARDERGGERGRNDGHGTENDSVL